MIYNYFNIIAIIIILDTLYGKFQTKMINILKAKNKIIKMIQNII